MVFKLARCIQTAASLKSRVLGSLLLPPKFPECVKRAALLIWEHKMSLTDRLLSEGWLESLDVYTRDGINRTIHYSKGCFGHQTNMALYNIPEHIVLPPESCFAELILREFYEGPLHFAPNHQKAMNTLAKSRER